MNEKESRVDLASTWNVDVSDVKGSREHPWCACMTQSSFSTSILSHNKLSSIWLPSCVFRSYSLSLMLQLLLPVCVKHWLYRWFEHITISEHVISTLTSSLLHIYCKTVREAFQDREFDERHWRGFIDLSSFIYYLVYPDFLVLLYYFYNRLSSENVSCKGI